MDIKEWFLLLIGVIIGFRLVWMVLSYISKKMRLKRSRSAVYSNRFLKKPIE